MTNNAATKLPRRSILDADELSLATPEPIPLATPAPAPVPVATLPPAAMPPAAATAPQPAPPAAARATLPKRPERFNLTLSADEAELLERLNLHLKRANGRSHRTNHTVVLALTELARKLGIAR